MAVLACNEPVVTSDRLVGEWRFVRINRALSEALDPGPMHLGFLIKEVRGDSVFGQAYSFLTDEPVANRRCNPLTGVRKGTNRFTFTFQVNNPPAVWFVSVRVVNDSLRVDDVRAGAEGNVMGLGSSLLFARSSKNSGEGCLTSA
jgi:hypothetical protein